MQVLRGNIQVGRHSTRAIYVEALNRSHVFLYREKAPRDSHVIECVKERNRKQMEAKNKSRGRPIVAPVASSPVQDKKEEEKVKEEEKGEEGEKANGVQHQCPHCPKIFSLLTNLKRHEEQCSSKPEVFHCVLCDKPFDRRSSLTNHQRMHDELRLLKEDWRIFPKVKMDKNEAVRPIKVSKPSPTTTTAQVTRKAGPIEPRKVVMPYKCGFCETGFDLDQASCWTRGGASI